MIDMLMDLLLRFIILAIMYVIISVFVQKLFAKLFTLLPKNVQEKILKDAVEFRKKVDEAWKAKTKEKTASKAE